MSLGRRDASESPLVVFGRNAAPPVAWLSLWPMTDPLDAVGFGPDIGVSCMDAPIGSQVVMLDGSPGPQSRVIRVVTQVHPPRAEGTQSVWIDVAADGTALTADGTPVWWTDEPPSC
jgi:hypothetical protein